MVLGLNYFQKSSVVDFKELPLQRNFHEEDFIYADGLNSIPFKLAYTLESTIMKNDLKTIYLVWSKMIPSSVTREDVESIDRGFKHLQVDANNAFSRNFKNGSAYKVFAFSHALTIDKVFVTGNFNYSCLEQRYNFISPLAEVFNKPFVSEKFDFKPFKKLSLESLLWQHKKRLKTYSVHPLSDSQVARSYRDLLDYARLIVDLK